MMKNMKYRNIMLLLLCVITLSGCSFSGAKKGLELNGNCYENLKDFSEYSENTEVSKLSKFYLSAVNYEITKVDEKTMTVTMNVNVPVISDLVKEIVHSIVNGNQNVSYTDLRSKIEKELESELSSDTLERKSATLELPIQEQNGKYKIVSTDEWSELIYGDLARTYIEMFSQINQGGESE